MARPAHAWEFGGSPSSHVVPKSEYASPTSDGPMSPMQFPTPPGSTYGSPSLEHQGTPDQPADLSVSTMFYPGASHFQVAPDIALLTSDSVYFYAHSRRLLDSSFNHFGGLFSTPPDRVTPDQCPLVDVPLSSPILNLVLHAIYDFSCAHYGPSFDIVREAVECLPEFGLRPQTFVLPNSPLFALLMSHAPVRPMEVYAIAGHLDLHDLAVATSSHMLSYPLATITDDVARRVGPVYLKRLFFLHLGRMDALRRVLLQTPHPHPPTPECDFTEQKRLTRAWSLATAYLAFDARPDMSTSSMESVLNPLAEHLTCEHCLKSLNDRIKNLLVSWSLIKRTI